MATTDMLDSTVKDSREKLSETESIAADAETGREMPPYTDADNPLPSVSVLEPATSQNNEAASDLTNSETAAAVATLLASTSDDKNAETPIFDMQSAKTEPSDAEKSSESPATNNINDTATVTQDSQPLPVPGNSQVGKPQAEVSGNSQAGSPVVITQNGQAAGEAPIVIDDESDDEQPTEKPTTQGRPNGSQSPRKTRLECSFNEGSFCCVTCDYKTPSNISFASHVVIHLHRAGDNGLRLCNICKCDKIIDVVKNCPLVRNMMKLLVEQKNKWKQEQDKKQEEQQKHDQIESIDNEVHASSQVEKSPTNGCDKSVTVNANANMTNQNKNTNCVNTTNTAKNIETLEVSGNSKKPAASISNNSGDKLEPLPSLDNITKKATGKRSTAVKIIYEHGKYHCRTCNYSVENESTFRKHLWKDLHKKLECNHCPEHIKYDKFKHCTVLNQFMKLLEKNKAVTEEKDRKNSHALGSPAAKSPAKKEMSPACLPTVTSSPVACKISLSKSKPDKPPKDSTEMSSLPLPDNADISLTLAMLDGLNQAQALQTGQTDTAKTLPSFVEDNDSNAPSTASTAENKESEPQEIEKTLVENASQGCVAEEAMEVRENNVEDASDTNSDVSDAVSTSKGYICPVPCCNNWTTLSQTQFKTHIDLKHGDLGPLNCVYCAQVFDTTDELMTHVDSEHMKFDKNKFLFRCSFEGCVFSSNVVIDFRVHNIIKHKNDTSFKCCHCAQTFDTTESLISHIQSNILNLAQCTICRCTSTNKNIITKHIRSVHPGQPRKINMEVYVCCQPEVFTAHIPDNAINKGTVPPIILRRKETTYLCPCDFVAKDIYAFKEHINMCNMHRKKSHYVVPPVVTSVAVPKPGNLEDEIESEVTDDNKTEDVESVDQSDMDAETVVTEPRSVSPPPKPGVFEQLGHEENLPCEQCNYATCFRQFHNSHKEVHASSKDPAKCFVCQYCPFSTNEQNVFVYHFNCHQGRKILRVFQCKYCDLSSNQNDFIEDHLIEAHPDNDIRFECAPKKLDCVPCIECENSFENEKQLLDHMKETHGDLVVKNYAEIVYGVIIECSDEDKLPMTNVQHIEPEPVSLMPEDTPSEKSEPPLDIAEGYLTCTYCSYCTHDVEIWKQHLKKHIGIGSQQLLMYCCRMCDWPSNDSRRVIDHCMKEHLMSAEQARESGYESNNLEITISEDLRSGGTNTEAPWEIPAGIATEKYHCDVCDFTAIQMALLSKHKLENHGTIEDEEDEPIRIPPSKTTASPSKIGSRYPAQVGSMDKYICQYCPYTTDKTKHWHSHRVTHEKQMAIQFGLKCGYCRTMSTKLNTMRYHHNRYHYDKTEKFYKVTDGIPTNELVVSADEIEKPVYGSTLVNRLKLGLPSTSGPQPMLLKELLTAQRRSAQLAMQSTNQQAHYNSSLDTLDDDESSGDGCGVIEEDEIESNEEYQEESHIIKAKLNEDPSKYCIKVPGSDLHQCIRCTFSHKYPSKVLRHFRYRHERFCPYRCGYCSFTSVESPKIRRHIHIIHKNMPVKILDTASDGPYGIETTPEFRAERAAAIGVQEDLEYIIHKFIVKGDGNVQCCLLCGYRQEGASSLKRHLFAIHLQYYPYKCKYCDLTAVEKNKVIKHLEKCHHGQEPRIVRLRFKGPLPEVPDHLKGIAGNDYMYGDTDDSQNEFETMVDDDEPTGLGLKITNVASVPSRDSMNVSATNWSEAFSSGNITSAHITMSSEDGHVVRVKQEKNFSDAGYGLMPSNVSMQDDDDEESSMDLGRLMVKSESGTGIMISPSNSADLTTPKKLPPSKNKLASSGEVVHKMCMYCNYTTRWNIGDVKTHILVTHLKRYPYGCKYCGYTGRDKKKLKNHCKAQHPNAANGTGFRYLYNEYANILVVKKIGKEMYIGVKGLDSIEAVEKASRMTMDELRELAGPEDEEEVSPPPLTLPLEESMFKKSTSSDAAEAMIRKHQEQLQRQIKGIAVTDEPLDLSVASQQSPDISDGSALKEIHKSFLQEQVKHNQPNLSVNTAAGQESGEFTNKHLQCRKCGYVHFDMYKLKVHILGRHLKLKPYACSACGFDDFTSHKVNKHVLEDHPDCKAVLIKNIVKKDPEIKKYVGHVDTSKKLVRPYMRMNNDEGGAPKPFGCGYCNYQAMSRTKIKYHSIRKHKGTDVKVVDRRNKMSTPKAPASTFTPMSAGMPSPITSPIVSPTIRQASPAMLNPDVSVEQNLNFTCSKCLQPFQNEDDLESHEARAHAVIGVYQCAYCPSRQRHQYKLKQHQKLKHPNQPIKMVLIHVDEAQHKKKSSPVIPVRPPQEFGLSNIMNPKKTFNGVYQCGYCPSRISYKAKMNWHQRVKHPEQPQKYDFIPNEMSDKARAMAARRAKIVVPDWRAKLQRPVPTAQEDVYKCKACSFTTRDQFCMRNHAQAHTGYRPYRCPYCAYGNVKSFPVKMHVRKHHPNMPVKHKVERDHMREAELRQYYSSPMRKNKTSDESPLAASPPPSKKRMIEFDTSEFALPAPIVTKHEPMSEEEDSEQSSTNNSFSHISIRPFCCVLCGHGSQDATGIKRHLMWELKYLPYSCLLCNYRDVHPSGVESHARKVHKQLPAQSHFNRDVGQEEYIKNLVDQSRTKPVGMSSYATPTAFKSTARMSYNTLKAIRKSGNKPTSLFKCKDCGFITTKYKHIQNHVVRHGPKRHQCAYCEFQAFYPYEISQHASKFHPTLPLMSNHLELNGKKAHEYYDVVKMTADEAEKLMNGEVPNFVTEDKVQSISAPVSKTAVTRPDLMVSKPGPKSFKLKRQALVSPIIDGLRVPEYEFLLNEKGNYKCRYCDYENDALQHYKNHLMKHVPPRWKCFYCKCQNQLSYDLRKHIKKYHPGRQMKIIKLDLNRRTAEDFESPRTGIAYTVNLNDWEELLQGLAPPGRKDTDTIIVPEHPDMFTEPVAGPSGLTVKQEQLDYYFDDDSTSDAADSTVSGSGICLNCCYCPFSTRDTSVYAAHLRTHTSNPDDGESDSDEDAEDEDLATLMIRMQVNQPVVRVINIMELDPVALEGLLHSHGVTGICF